MHCVTNVLITYLPQLNETHWNLVHFLALPQCSSRYRDGNTTKTATYGNTAAADYERSLTVLEKILNRKQMTLDVKITL